MHYVQVIKTIDNYNHYILVFDLIPKSKKLRCQEQKGSSLVVEIQRREANKEDTDKREKESEDSESVFFSTRSVLDHILLLIITK